jgi:4-alpha-glucanotransferase
LPDWQKQYVWGYLRRAPGDNGEIAAALMKLAWSSPAALAIAPLQDILNLGNEARMNLPGRADGNWHWRCTDEMLVRVSFDLLRDLTRESGRAFAQPIQLENETTQ